MTTQAQSPASTARNAHSYMALAARRAAQATHADTIAATYAAHNKARTLARQWSELATTWRTASVCAEIFGLVLADALQDAPLSMAA